MRWLVLACALTGCSQEAVDLAAQSLPTLAKIAGPHLKALAAKQGVELDESGAICVEMPIESAEELLPDGYVIPVTAVMCVAPELEP